MIRFLLATFVAICLFYGQALAAPSDTTAQFDTETGLFVVKHHTVDVVNATFVFWTGKWSGNPPKIETKISGPFNYVLSVANKEKGLDLRGSARRIGTNRMEWRMRMTSSADADWGLSIGFDLAPFAGEAFVPQLDVLPDKDGWSLKLVADEEPVRFLVSPAPSDVFFERDYRNEVRVYFANRGEKLAAGDYTITVELPMGSVVMPTPAERLATPDLSWYNNLLDASISPVDLSFLNEVEKPAGKHGTLAVQGDQLTFKDGTLVRFWGANLSAYALFHTGLSDTVIQAKRLSKLGFNLVRIHHFDSEWVKPNILGRETAADLELNDESLRRLDWWIKALSDEGIYVWLDLNVGRVFSTDGLSGAEEMTVNGLGPSAKGYAYFNSGIEARMKELNRLLLKHVNPYTQLAYKDDPRIAFLLLTNENDLTHHFGNMFLPDKKLLKHNSIYMAEAAHFAAEKGLDSDATWKSLRFGPSKLFLSEMEHRFNERMIADIRSSGSKTVISTTNSFGNMTVAGLPSLADGGVVAVNAYAKSGLLETDPRYAPNLINWVAAVGLAGKPLAITEWNMGKHPSYDRSALPAYFASIASFQDWNAPMEYAYSQSPSANPGSLANWEMTNDAALLSMMPVGALIFRQHHVRPGETIRYLRPTVEKFIDTALSPDTSQAIRTLTETSRWRLALPTLKELDWFKPSAPGPDGKVITDMAADFAGGGDTICAETGDFCRNWRRGIFTVDTPMTQLASGWIGGESIALTSAKISLKTPYAALAVQSLDSKPIADSRSILLSMTAQTLPPQGGATAIRSEPIIGEVTFQAPPGLAAYAQFGNGRQKQIPAPYDNGSYSLALDASLGTYWIAFRDAP